MRSILRTALAASAVAGLLAIPVAGASAIDDSTTAQLTLNGVAGTLSISVPAGTAAAPVDLGAMDIAAGTAATQNSLGEVVVSDTTTGLLRTATVTVDTGLDNTLLGFCQDDSGDPTDLDGLTCSADADKGVLKTNVLYDFVDVVEGGDAIGATVETDGVLGAATAVYTSTGAGGYTMTWTPTLNVTLLGNEAAGTYYGVIKHSVTAAGV